MAKLSEKLWNWGHLETSHNKVCNYDCKMTPEEFAKEYGVDNAFVICYGGNIQPPFDDLAKRFSSLREVKWSVLGDRSSPLPESELGNTEDVVNAAKVAGNISGGIVDDFFSPERMARYTPDVLAKIKGRLNSEGLDFWSVLYEDQLNDKLPPYLECFDGVSFWIWKQAELLTMESAVEKFLSYTPNKRRMLGIYLYDYDIGQELDVELFKKQLHYYIDLLKAKKIEGIIFCSGCIGDMELDTNRYLKEYLSKNKDMEI